MVPAFWAITQSPENLATVLSIPVPTSGVSVDNVGTACLIIFEPIRALFASSCSKKGIKAAAIETTCWGETSIKSTLEGFISSNSFLYLTGTSSSVNLLFLSIFALAWAITNSPSSIAETNLISSVTFPFLTSLYGVSIKPYSFTLE